MEDQKSLLKKLADQEKEIQALYRQQRDVRFLMKRLNIEVGLRLHKRASPVKESQRLIYADDPILTAALTKELAPSELLKVAHSRDVENIQLKRQVLGSFIKTIKWKMAAWTFDTTTKILKKVVTLR